jgi:hypothetical protein
MKKKSYFSLSGRTFSKFFWDEIDKNLKAYLSLPKVIRAQKRMKKRLAKYNYIGK